MSILGVAAVLVSFALVYELTVRDQQVDSEHWSRTANSLETALPASHMMEEDLNGHAEAPTADRLRFSVNLKSRMLSIAAFAALLG